MIPLKINEIITAIKGKPVTSFPPHLMIKSISTDTRTLKAGDLFFALKGANFDGHNFLNKAVQLGASGLVIAPAHNLHSPPAFGVARPFGRRTIRGRLCAGKNIPIIQVTDTVRALGDLARYYRPKIPAKVIAITGSNGKTTTKEMIHHMLTKIAPKGSAFGSPRSFNNAIGVPLALLSVEPSHRYAVFELGTNQPGEISYLAHMVKPDIGVITNIMPSHLEGLKNLAGVAREKGVLFKTLPADGMAVYQPNNKWLKQATKTAEYKSVTFGETYPAFGEAPAKGEARPSGRRPKGRRANIQGQRLKIKPAAKGEPLHRRDGIEFLVNRRIRCFIPILGSWNMSNALAALAVMQALGFSIARSARYLSDFKLPPMRMERKVHHGVTFINDAYNANPESVSRLLTDLKRIKPTGRKILVLGDMLELGKMSRRFHREIADKIAQAGVEILFAVGKAVDDTVKVLRKKHPEILTFYFTSTSEVGDTLGDTLKKGDLVVFKGSRAVGLEEVVRRAKLALVK